MRAGFLLAALCAVSPHASAQNSAAEAAAATGRSFSVTPRISTAVTATDNIELTANRKSDVYTQVSPGVSLASNGGRLRGTLDYTLNGYAYAQSSSKNQVQHALNSAFTAEAVEDWAFVDFNGSVSQQVVSAFGTQSPSAGQNTGNQSQVATYALSPFVKGRLLGGAAYEARLRFGGAHAESAEMSNSRSEQAIVRLNGTSGLSWLNWAALLTRQSDEFDAGRSTTSDRFNGTLTFQASPQLGISVFSGYESSNQASAEKLDGETYGFGVNWRPSPRTTFSAQGEHRLFGKTYNLVFEHRTPRSVWRYSSGRDVNTGSNPSTGAVLSAYDLYFTQFASLEPDPVRRQALVNAFLLANGISPTSTVGGGFLTSALTVQRRQDLSFGLIGARTSATLLASRTDSSQLGGATPGSVGDLATFGDIRQTAFSLNLSHRLTPIASLSLLLSEQRTKGSANDQSTVLRLVSLNWSSKLSPRSSVSLGARHAAFDSPTAPYDENAVTGIFSLQF